MTRNEVCVRLHLVACREGFGVVKDVAAAAGRWWDGEEL